MLHAHCTKSGDMLTPELLPLTCRLSCMWELHCRSSSPVVLLLLLDFVGCMLSRCMQSVTSFSSMNLTKLLVDLDSDGCSPACLSVVAACCPLP